MAEVERKRLTDGFTTLQKGVDSSKSPMLLSSGEIFSAVTASRLINVTVRGGFASNRPPVVKLALYFQNSEQQDWFEGHNVQGRLDYKTPTKTFTVYSIGGRIFRVDPLKMNGPNVLEITPVGDPNPSNRPHAWMVQAEQYLVIQDGQSLALIYDGSTCLRSKDYAPYLTVPVGTAMTYGLGRLVVALPGGRTYVVGDILGGGTEVIQFTEDSYLAEGGSIPCPIPGTITALKIVSAIDRSTGQGDLFVFTTNGAASARIGEKRSTWKDIQFQVVAMLTEGSVSQNAVTLVNGDAFMRSPDGIRSIAMTRSEFQNSWSTTPLSNEMTKDFSFDTDSLLPFCESALFDNRLLTLCNQVPLVNGCYHTGIIALDFDLISSMSGKLPPAYDGLWVGLKFTSILASKFSGKERCFVTHRNPEGKNEIWELLKTGYLDDGRNRITSVIEGASLLRVGSTPQSLKSLDGGDISLENLTGDIDVQIQFKPDQSPCWTDWATLTMCAKDKDCGACPAVTYQPQYRAKKRFGQPPDTCSASDNKPVRLGYSFQPRITITGGFTMNCLRAIAYEIPESLGGCDADE